MAEVIMEIVTAPQFLMGQSMIILHMLSNNFCPLTTSVLRQPHLTGHARKPATYEIMVWISETLSLGYSQGKQPLPWCEIGFIIVGYFLRQCCGHWGLINKTTGQHSDHHQWLMGPRELLAPFLTHTIVHTSHRKFFPSCSFMSMQAMSTCKQV